jgi:hypothetical protein
VLPKFLRGVAPFPDGENGEGWGLVLQGGFDELVGSRVVLLDLAVLLM